MSSDAPLSPQDVINLYQALAAQVGPREANRLLESVRRQQRLSQIDMREVAVKEAKSVREGNSVRADLIMDLLAMVSPAPEDRAAQLKRARTSREREQGKLRTELEQIAKSAAESPVDTNKIAKMSDSELVNYLDSSFSAEGQGNIPVRGDRAYEFFSAVATNPDEYNELMIDAISEIGTPDLGQAYDQNAAKAQREARDLAKTWVRENGPRVFQLLSGPTTRGIVEQNKEPIEDLVAAQIQEAALLRGREAFVTGRQAALGEELKALEEGGPEAGQLLIGDLHKAVELVTPIADEILREMEGAQEGALSAPEAAVAANGDDQVMRNLMGLGDMTPQQQLSTLARGAMDPISSAAVDFNKRRVAATEDPSFMLWREKTGSTGQGTPNYNEYMRYNRQAMRAQAGGVLGPAVPRTGDVRLIAYKDTRGAYETDDAGTVYFYNEDSGLPESPEAVGRVADKAVEGADVVTFELDAVDGLRSKLGVAVVDVVGDAAEDALREGGSRVYYDRKSGDFVVLDEDRKVLAKDRVGGPRARRLQELAGDSSFADVLGDLAGLQRGESGNSAKSGSLADLEVGEQDNAHGTFVPKGTLYTTKAPVRYVAGEVVYRKGQSAGVLNILDAGEKGRGDNRVRQISTQDVIFTSAEGRDGFKKARADLEKMLNERVESGALKDKDRDRVLDDLTIPDEEMERAFRRSLRQRVNDFVRGDARRARTEMRETTLPFTPSGRDLPEDRPKVEAPDEPAADGGAGAGGGGAPKAPLRDALRDSARSAGETGRGVGVGSGVGVGAEEAVPPLRLPSAQKPTIYQGDTPDIDGPNLSEAAVPFERFFKLSMPFMDRKLLPKTGVPDLRGRKFPTIQTDGTGAALIDYSTPIKSLTSPTPLVTDAPQTTPVADAAPSEDTGALEPVSEEDEERARKRMEALRSQAAEVEEAERRAAAQQVP